MATTDPPVSTLAPQRGFAMSYIALVVLPLLGLLVLLQIGAFGLPTHHGVVTPVRPPALGLLKLPLLLGQIVVILLASRGLGWVLRKFGQPQVIGEMITGLLLGHSVLEVVAPSVHEFLFPRGSLRFLNALSQIGVLMFIFLVGVEMDRHLLRRRGRAALLTSHASIAVPMFFGVALAMALYTRMAPMGVAFTPFALFLGAAMSVTAFPVLVRILNERKMQHTETGMIAIASAAIDDVTAWCVLALVVVIARSESTALPLWATLTGLGLHVALMLSVVRPLLQKYATRVLDADGITSALVGTIVIVTLGSAWLTEVLGVHALFGAFLAGIVMPKDERFVAGVKQRFEDVMLVLLLPLFFAYSGLRANVTLLHGWEAWGTCLAITGVAVAGKLLGSTAASRAAGLPWRQAGTIGALMNTRGLMELIILNVGLDLKVITPELFAMMVLMAIITTLMTSPLVGWLNPPGGRAAMPALERETAAVPVQVA